MRTTVTLESDTEALLRKRMRERRVSFKQALNDAIREGLSGSPAREGFRTKTADLGLPAVDLDHALRLAADLEDDELVRKMRAGQ
ncbi:MAG: antitoxin [Acidimicrobiales bacterium]